MTANHNYQRRVQRDHTTIDIGVSNYWLSIVVERGEWHFVDEIALVRRTLATGVSPEVIECVPLREWWDKSISEENDDLVLDYDNPQFYGFSSQGHLLMTAITCASVYARSGKAANPFIQELGKA